MHLATRPLDLLLPPPTASLPCRHSAPPLAPATPPRPVAPSCPEGHNLVQLCFLEDGAEEARDFADCVRVLRRYMDARNHRRGVQVKV